MKISKSMRKQLLERAMRKTGIPTDSSCWIVTDLIPADCKMQEFWPLIEGWLKEHCSNEPYSTYTEFGQSIFHDARTLYRALLGEYAELQDERLQAVYEDAFDWDTLLDAPSQDARCVLVKYFLLEEEAAELVPSQGFTGPFSTYIPRTRYGKYVESIIRG